MAALLKDIEDEVRVMVNLYMIIFALAEGLLM